MFLKNNTLAKNKLILLYILKKIDLPLSDAQILQFVSDQSLMGYFDVATLLEDMVSTHLLEKTEAINGIFYRPTEIGDSMLTTYQKELPLSLREYIHSLFVNKIAIGFLWKVGCLQNTSVSRMTNTALH